MAKVTREKLIELVEKSRLATREAIRAALDKIREQGEGSLPGNAVDLAKALQKQKIVTRWHCEKLLQGKYKGFFLGKHKLLGHIGSGGMSSVYLAEHTKMGDLRAIKVLPQSKLGKSSYLARFQQEAKAIASLNHINVVRAHDIDNQGDTHYIVMEYVDGDDLQTIVKKKGPMAFDLVAEYIAQAAHGLQHAHDVGLIHRDVKPANVLLNSKGQIKILDLGLALFTDDAEASLTIDFNDKVLGTADYLAPEQALNSHNVDHRADLYGLGCTMYFLLTGHPPFPDGTIAQRIAKHQREMPPEIRKIRAETPGELEGICWKLLQKDAKFRYASAKQTAVALEGWLAKHRAAAPVTAGGPGGSSLALGDERSPGDSNRSANDSNGMIDTVSNRGSDTVTGKSASSLANLSASDSGVLVRIAKRSAASDTSSQINLEAEIAARKHYGKSGGSSTHGGNSTHGTNPKTPVPAPLSPVALPTTGKTKALWIVGLVILFALAVFLGIVIERFASPPAVTTPPAAANAEYNAATEFALLLQLNETC